jgi:hypothetical protein
MDKDPTNSLSNHCLNIHKIEGNNTREKIQQRGLEKIKFLSISEVMGVS